MVNMQSMNEHHLSLIPLFYMSTRIRRKSFREFWPKTQFEVSRTSNLCWGKSLKPWDDALPITKSSNVVMFVKRDRTERVIKTSSPFRGDGFIRQKCGTIVSRTHNPVENETQVCKKKKVKNQPAGDSSVPLPIAINAFLLPPSQLFWGCQDCMKSRLVDEVTRARFQTLKVTQGQDSQCLRSSWSSYFLCFHFSFLKRAGSIFKKIFFGFISHAVQQTQ